MVCSKGEQADKAVGHGKTYHNHKRAHQVCKWVCLPSFFLASLAYQGEMIPCLLKSAEIFCVEVCCLWLCCWVRKKSQAELEGGGRILTPVTQ
jgi:hypothetical protein